MIKGLPIHNQGLIHKSPMIRLRCDQPCRSYACDRYLEKMACIEPHTISSTNWNSYSLNWFKNCNSLRINTYKGQYHYLLVVQNTVLIRLFRHWRFPYQKCWKIRSTDIKVTLDQPIQQNSCDGNYTWTYVKIDTKMKLNQPIQQEITHEGK
jgi:hypothetical protein